MVRVRAVIKPDTEILHNHKAVSHTSGITDFVKENNPVIIQPFRNSRLSLIAF
jgi:hypothetical protein